jgi:rhamnosyltransferase
MLAMTKWTGMAVIVPTLNAAGDWPAFAPALVAAVESRFVMIIDSSSMDGTTELARAEGFRVHVIPQSEFNHGSTRQLAADLLPDAEVLIYLTQDALLASPGSIAELLKAFEDPKVGAVYGRQLPHKSAGPIEAHARLFNYPTKSEVRALDSRRESGIKTVFISNSFAAYRRDALMAVGGFPRDVIFGEDTITAAKLLLLGWKIAYVAEAQVYHSHSYTWMQDFKRYFDIGVLHARESWLLKEFGGAGGEGGRFVRSELCYLWPKHAWWLLSALIRTGLKFAGYRLGRNENRIPLEWKRKLSMHRSFWR